MAFSSEFIRARWAAFLRVLNFALASWRSLVSLARSTLMCWMSSMSVWSVPDSSLLPLTLSSWRRPEMRLNTALKLFTDRANRTCAQKEDQQ